MVKNPEFFFFFFKATTRTLEVTLFRFGQIYSISLVCLQHIMKTALLLRYLLITYLVTLCLKTEIFVLESSLEKVLNFGSQNLYELWLFQTFWKQRYSSFKSIG